MARHRHDAAAAPCGPVNARRVFHGLASQVPMGRHFVADVLSGCPAAADAVLMASELLTNAVIHSRSGTDGTLAVTVAHGAARVRVEVDDQGGPWIESPDASGERGRGLIIVSELAAAWGITGDENGRVVWFEIDCR